MQNSKMIRQILYNMWPAKHSGDFKIDHVWKDTNPWPVRAGKLDIHTHVKLNG